MHAEVLLLQQQQVDAVATAQRQIDALSTQLDTLRVSLATERGERELAETMAAETAWLEESLHIANESLVRLQN